MTLFEPQWRNGNGGVRVLRARVMFADVQNQQRD